MLGRALNAIEKHTGVDLDGDGDVGEAGGTGFVSRASNFIEAKTGLDLDGDGDVGEENPVDRRRKVNRNKKAKVEEEAPPEEEEEEPGIWCPELGDRVSGIDVQRLPRGPRGLEPCSVDPENWRMKRNLARMRAYKERIEELNGEQERHQWPGMPPRLRVQGVWPHYPQVPSLTWAEGEDPMQNRRHKYWDDPRQPIPPSRVQQSFPIRGVEKRLVFGIKDGRSI